METEGALNQVGYKPVTTAMIALYASLAEREHHLSSVQEVLDRFLHIGKLATLSPQSADRDVLYSIAAPGIGLCYCLTVVNNLYQTAASYADCPLCHGERILFESDEETHETVVEKCACETAVSDQLSIWQSCYQAALMAWMEWRGLDDDTLRKCGMETLEQNVLKCILEDM